ncbi:hypothetical protein D3C76_1419880 [compost metagenome]
MYDRNDNIGVRCITLLFEGFTEEEIALQGRFYERMISNLEKFSETLLTLAKQNAEVTVPPTPEQKHSSTPKKSNYLSY